MPSIKKYRNAFETIRQRVIDHIAEAPDPEPRQMVPNLSADLTIEQPDLVRDDANFEQMSQILASISGEDWTEAWNYDTTTYDFGAVDLDFDFNDSLGDSSYH